MSSNRLTQLWLEVSLLVLDRPHPQEHTPPTPLLVLKNIRVPSPLYLLIRSIIPQRLSPTLPRTKDTILTPKHPLLMSRLCTTLSNKKIVEPVFLHNMTPLSDTILALPNTNRRRQRP